MVHRATVSRPLEVVGVCPNAQSPGRHLVMCPPRKDDLDGSGCLLHGTVALPKIEAFFLFFFRVHGALKQLSNALLRQPCVTWSCLLSS